MYHGLSTGAGSTHTMYIGGGPPNVDFTLTPTRTRVIGLSIARWAHVARAVMIEMSTAKFRGSLGQAGAA